MNTKRIDQIYKDTKIIRKLFEKLSLKDELPDDAYKIFVDEVKKQNDISNKLNDESSKK